MKRQQIGAFAAVAVGFAIAVAISAHATLVPKDSADFNHKYEGDVVPLPNYTALGAFATGPTTDGDIMTYRVNLSGGYWDSDDWSGAATPDGWTIEMRLKIGTDRAPGSRGAVALYTGNGSAGDLIGIGPNDVKILAHSEIVADTNDNTDDFHTFRVAFDHVGSVWPYTVYRDNVLLASWPNGGNWGSDTLYIGSGGSVYGGPTVEVDYIRWDNTGAWAPIPEPAALALLGAGSLLLVVARRRRRIR